MTDQEGELTFKTDPEREELVRDLLVALGTTAEEVAAALLDKACFGRRGDENFCPVATYLQWGGLPYATIDGEVAMVDHLTGATIDLPGPIHDFVLAFDGGRFDELLEEEAEE